MANGEDGEVIYYITCGSLGYCAEASCLSRQEAYRGGDLPRRRKLRV